MVLALGWGILYGNLTKLLRRVGDGARLRREATACNVTRRGHRRPSRGVACELLVNHSRGKPSRGSDSLHAALSPANRDGEPDMALAKTTENYTVKCTGGGALASLMELSDDGRDRPPGYHSWEPKGNDHSQTPTNHGQI
jgi:hypothetical protein